MVLPPGLQSAREVKAFYDQRYENLIQSGDYVPFLYPWATIGAATILLYLLIDHRRSPALQSLRFPLYGSLCAFSAWSILNHKARSPAAAYGVGLVQSWGTLWTGAIMFFNDCQRDFKRIERTDGEAVERMCDRDENSGAVLWEGSEVPEIEEETIGDDIKKMQSTEQDATQGPAQREGPVIWQEYPSRPFIERIDWLADVFCAFRGVGWNFQTTGIPSPPPWVTLQLNGNYASALKIKDRPASKFTISDIGIRRLTDCRCLLQDVLVTLTLSYIALDIIKCIMHHDAYFWGYMDAEPPTWLPDFIRTSFVLVKSYRLLISLGGVYFALHAILSLGPLVFVCILGPNYIGLRGEPWMNPPDFYGNFASILDKGLAGWWGSFWHQTFRYSFEAPASRIMEYLEIEKRSQAGKLVGLVVAFFLSGCLHACGSYTQLGDTTPLKPFLFFQMQTMGIILQSVASARLKRAGIIGRLPKVVRQWTNFLVTLTWLYFTAPLLVDDFAKGGVWLYEPLPISPLRMLGFGASDDNGWDVMYGLVFWHRGRNWWDTGIAF